MQVYTSSGTSEGTTQNRAESAATQDGRTGVHGTERGRRRKVGNRTESRRLEVGGTGAEISFYGRVTNLRTRHCRVPADGRTMRLRNTMLHSGNLKAVLTTNLQPPMPPPCMPPSRSFVAPSSSPICVYQYSPLRHIPPLDRRPRHPSPPAPFAAVAAAVVVTFSFFHPYPLSLL